MSKNAWIVLAVVLALGGCCLFSGLALMLVGVTGEEGPVTTVGGPVALIDRSGGTSAAGDAESSVVGTWGTNSLGLQPYDESSGSFGPLNAEGATLTLNADGTFERVWVKMLRGQAVGTWLAGAWTLEDGVLTLDVERSKTTAGGTPADHWEFDAARKDIAGVPFLVLKDHHTGITEQLRLDGR